MAQLFLWLYRLKTTIINIFRSEGTKVGGTMIILYLAKAQQESMKP